jgi:hypothetical protein
MENESFLVPPRLPLGEFHAGECRAVSAAHVPTAATLTKYCNHGYSRGGCDRFPEDAGVDAVRFHIAASQPGCLSVQFVLEKGCWPAAHGFLEYSQNGGKFHAPHPDPIVQRQAEAFVDSFRRRSSL